MAENSKIQWTHHTFNPWRGCTKVSAGCANCYADAQSKRNPQVLGIWGPQGTRVVASETQWREPLRWNREAELAGERHRVFCASMADVFERWDGPMVDASGNRLHVGEGLIGGTTHSAHWYSESPCDCEPAPLVRVEHVRARLLKLIHLTPNLDWLFLTKRPEFLKEALRRTADYATNVSVPQDIRDGAELAGQWINYGVPMPNVWLGTSVENQAAADARIPHLLRVPAAVRFLSCEPLLGPVRLSPYRDATGNVVVTQGIDCDWVIVGGESGGKARPFAVEWARSLVEQCQAAGVPVFVKQLGAVVHATNIIDPLDQFPKGCKSFRTGPGEDTIELRLRDEKGGDPDEWPADLRVREFPTVKVA